jgi:dipeptidyl-peptidase 4
LLQNLKCMKFNLLRVLALFYCCGVLVVPSVGQTPTPKTITIEDIYQNGTFRLKGIPGFNFQRDGVHYTLLSQDQRKIEQYSLLSGTVTDVLFDAKKIKGDKPAGWKDAFDAYQFSADEAGILLMTEAEAIYRWSSKGQGYYFNVQKNTLEKLYDGQPQRAATFSPDGSKVAFVVDNDLYIKELGVEKVMRVTTDGRINNIINGVSDWLYEEEFELVRAFEWSPDSKRLAYLRFDESQVPEMTMEEYRDSTYPTTVKFKYPKVGEKNAVVTAHLYDLSAATSKQIELSAAADDYLPRLKWTPQGELCLTRLNRLQNHIWLTLTNPASGQTRTLLEETNEFYLDLREPQFLKDGSFIWMSPKSGYDHLYLHDAAGKEVLALTTGAFDVTQYYGVDEKNGLVFYQAASVNAMQRELFSVNLKGKKRTMLNESFGATRGSHDATFSSTFDYWVHTYSTCDSPPQYAVRDRKGKEVRTLEQNEALRARREEYGAVPMEFFQTTGTALPLNGWMMKPANLAPDQKVPVMMFVYGGPGDQKVTDAWRNSNYWWFQMLVQKGYIVACVDNRGTGGRGEQFKKMTYLQLGKYETEDQIAAAQYLGTMPFVDKDRIGIFGWSYGGYMASSALFKGKGTFKAAIAVAPVTNWKWYDSAYTERYMRTYADNKKGYDDNSPTNFADQMEGDLLLIHGLADDNVHFQHSAELTNRLIQYNKQFESMLYPNRNHGIGDKAARLHLYRLMTDFLDKSLMNTKNKP